MSQRLDRLGMFRAIAAKIEREPAFLEVGLANIDRWIASGIDQRSKLEEWRERILAAQRSPEALQELISLLSDENERAEYEREFSPFAGVLTTAERRPFLLECSYSH